MTDTQMLEVDLQLAATSSAQHQSQAGAYVHDTLETFQIISNMPKLLRQQPMVTSYYSMVMLNSIQSLLGMTCQFTSTCS